MYLAQYPCLPFFVLFYLNLWCTSSVLEWQLHVPGSIPNPDSLFGSNEGRRRRFHRMYNFNQKCHPKICPKLTTVFLLHRKTIALNSLVLLVIKTGLYNLYAKWLMKNIQYLYSNCAAFIQSQGMVCLCILRQCCHPELADFLLNKIFLPQVCLPATKRILSRQSWFSLTYF